MQCVAAQTGVLVITVISQHLAPDLSLLNLHVFTIEQHAIMRRLQLLIKSCKQSEIATEWDRLHCEPEQE